MDYEKKYKELIEKMEAISHSALTVEQHQIIDTILGELKESEDERIRKELLEHCINRRDGKQVCVDASDYRRWADWLEKQGNSPIKWNKNTKDCKPKVSHSVLMKTTHGIAEGEWQGEHWHQYRWAGIVRDTDVLSWIELSDIEKQGEQKPIEWDADDEEKLYFLKARLKDYEDCIIYDEELSMCQKNNVRETTKEFIEWLDSIKERIGG